MRSFCCRCGPFPPTCRGCCCLHGGEAEMRPPWAWRQTPLRLPPTPAEVGGSDPPSLVHLVREANGLGCVSRFRRRAARTSPRPRLRACAGDEGVHFTRPGGAVSATRSRISRPEALFFPDRGFEYRRVPPARRAFAPRSLLLHQFARSSAGGWAGSRSSTPHSPGRGWGRLARRGRGRACTHG